MNKVWMKHIETGEVREVDNPSDELFRLMITGWNQCPAPNTEVEEKEQ
jgi:hypothetical protein